MNFPVNRVDRVNFHSLPEPPAQTASGAPVHRLNLNECPFQPSPSVIEAMATAAAQANLYPDGEARDLLTKLQAHLGQPEERLFVGAGSNELLAACAEVALDPGDQMIAPVPAFPTYEKLATLRNAEFIGVACTHDGRIDVDALLSAVTSRTRMMVVSSPHNPTGAVMSDDEIRLLATSLPDHALLHFDEAYFEFGRAVGAPDALMILAARSGPWLSTRTFSKAYAMAGARVGYGIASSAELALAIRKVRSNFSLNRMALAGAIAALDDQEFVDKLVGLVLSEKSRIGSALKPSGFSVLEGASNFAAIRTPTSVTKLLLALKDRGVLITNFLMNGDEYLRATIGSPDSNDALIAALTRKKNIKRTL